MSRVPLDSRILASALYDSGRRQLELEFRSGKRYRYFQVPQHCYEELLRAESKGAYFNHSIRDCYPFQDLSNPAAPLVLAARK